MNIPRASIRHPVTVVMIVLVAVTFGVMALFELPTDMFPEITFPVISVVTRYPGAAPEEVESMVTEQLEESLSTVHGVTSVTSISQHALSMVNLEFEWGSDLDSAAYDVRDAVQYAKRFLPDDVSQPAVVRIDLSKMPIYVGTLRGNRSLTALKRIAEKTIKPRLSRVDGVAALGIITEEEEEIIVEARLKALENFGVGLNRLLNLLITINRNIPGGDFDFGGKSISVRTMGEHTTVEELSDLPLISSPDGSAVTLGQLASVRRGIKKQNVSIQRNGETCLAIQVMKQSGKNTVKILDKVNVEIEKIRQILPADVKLEIVFDQSEFINQSTASVTGNLILGGILALLVLFVFLGKFSLLAIIGVAIPLSVIVTFIPVFMLKYTLNMMSLGGLALGVGMLVDNAIVVLENIDRHLNMGKTAAEAAADGTQEVAGAITGSTLTTIIIFAPFLLYQGIAARLFIPLGLTVTASLTASLFLSLTMVPVMAAYMIRFGKGYGVLPSHAFYRRMVNAALRWPKIVVAVFLAAFVIVLFGIGPRLGFEYIPIADDGMIGSPFKLPIGMSLEESKRALKPLVNFLASDSRVFSVFCRIGFPEGAEETGMVIGLADANEGEFFVRMIPKNKRNTSTREFLEEVRGQVAMIPGLEMNLRQSFEQLFTTQKKAIVVHVLGNHLPILKSIMAQVKARLATVTGIRDLDIDLQGGKPEYKLKVNRELAIKADLTVSQIGEAVRTALQGRKIGIFRDEGDEIYIRLIGPSRLKNEPEELLDLPLEVPPAPALAPAPALSTVRAPRAVVASRIVMLRDVATMIPSNGEEKIYHKRQMRQGSVAANYTGRPLGELMADVGKALSDLRLPDGYFLEQSGVYEDMISAMKQLIYVFLLGVLLVYMVMASQFESFLGPFCIMFTVPLAAIGMILALYLTGQTVNVSSAIGLLILLGIVVNNAIVMVDFVRQRRQEGLGIREALVESAFARLRPILMTTITTVLGLIPLALGLGEGTEIQQPMAIAIIGGLSFATLLTLFVIPCIYLIINERSSQNAA